MLEGDAAITAPIEDAWRAHLPPADGYAAAPLAHALVKELHRTHPGMRMLRVPWAFDLAIGAIL